MKLPLAVLLMIVTVTYGSVCPPNDSKATADYNAMVRQLDGRAQSIAAREQQQGAKDQQQGAKDQQQGAKDQQQNARDAQQNGRETQQNARDAALSAREAAVAKKEATVAQTSVQVVDPNPWKSDGAGGWTKCVNGEKWTSNASGTCIDGIPLDEALKIKGECAYMCEQDYIQGKDDYKKTHTNRSGGGDGTNPGGNGNINGFLNPGNANHVANGQTDKSTGVAVATK